LLSLTAHGTPETVIGLPVNVKVPSVATLELPAIVSEFVGDMPSMMAPLKRVPALVIVIVLAPFTLIVLFEGD